MTNVLCAALDTLMANHKVVLQPAYVLHQRAYRDTSALLELFSPEYGRVGVIAKGVRSAKSRWRGVLQPFQPLLVSWNKRGELGTLTAAEAKGPALTISPGLIASGFYLNEMLMRLLDRDEGQLELFGWYDETLRGLDNISSEISSGTHSKLVELEILLRLFEVRLLSALGYDLVLDQEAGTGSPLQAEQFYIYQLEHGPVMQEAGSVESPETRNVVDQAQTREGTVVGVRISGITLLALREGDFSDERVRLESKRLLRAVLGHYLGPKPLQSRHLAQSTHRQPLPLIVNN